jgi:hypothetical protein
MPVGNKFIAKYRTIFINGTQYLAESFNRSKTMDANDIGLLQGTVLAQILDIGGVAETISLDVPILVGGASVYDGRALLNEKLDELVDPAQNALPILENATINISKDRCTASISLLSDGQPGTSYFTVGGAQGTASSADPSYYLNPANNVPTRLAKWFDFRIGVGPYQLYIEQLTLNVKASTSKLYFMFGPGATGSLSQDIPTSNPYNFGTQFPWIAVTNVAISGSGTAAVEMNFGSSTINGEYGYHSGEEAVNVSINGDTATELSLQRPGNVLWENTGFTLEIFVPTTPSVADTSVNYTAQAGAYHAVFDSSVVDFSKCVITKADFKMPAGDKMTVNFDFHCWVGKPVS